MRQLMIQVPRPHGDELCRLAFDEFAPINLVRISARSPNLGDEPESELIVLVLDNGSVDGFVGALEQRDFPSYTTFFPQGTLALRPPTDEAAEQVTDVGLLSPLEVYLSGLQSIGSWRGFLMYAATAGVVVFIALYIGSIYLLTASMLIAPFAGPAMNLALGTATGDVRLLRQSATRYVAALATAVAVAALMSLLLGLQVPTSMMLTQSPVSSLAVALPVAAGIAGAIHLMSSERDSLVSGAGTGILVAASLAPPAGILGMAMTLGRWEMVRAQLFLLVLQLVGINLVAATVFRLLGKLEPQGPRGAHRSAPLARLGYGLTAAALAALMAWQFIPDDPSLRRDSIASSAAIAAQTYLSGREELRSLKIDAHWSQDTGPDALYLTAIVGVPANASGPTREALREELSQAIYQRLPPQVEIYLAVSIEEQKLARPPSPPPTPDSD